MEEEDKQIQAWEEIQQPKYNDFGASGTSPESGAEQPPAVIQTTELAPDNPKNAGEVVQRGLVNVANPPKVEPKLSPEEQAYADATAGYDRGIKLYRDWLERKGNRPETEEEREKRERREKSKKTWAAVSDGLGTLSNLFFTTQYAPNMYNHDKGSAVKSQMAAIDRARADREKNEDRYMQFALKLGDLENQKARTIREWEAQKEARKIAREKAEREAELHPILVSIKKEQGRKATGDADAAEYKASTAKTESMYAPEMQQAKLATENARAKAQNASATNSYASAAAHGRREANEFSAWDEHGKEHKFKTQAAADAYAKQHGTWHEQEVEETTHTESEGKGTSDTTRKKQGGYPANPQRKPSPTGGSVNNGKKSPTS